jgi:hypothetical protein
MEKDTYFSWMQTKYPQKLNKYNTSKLKQQQISSHYFARGMLFYTAASFQVKHNMSSAVE